MTDSQQGDAAQEEAVLTPRAVPHWQPPRTEPESKGRLRPSSPWTVVEPLTAELDESGHAEPGPTEPGEPGRADLNAGAESDRATPASAVSTGRRMPSDPWAVLEPLASEIDEPGTEAHFVTPQQAPPGGSVADRVEIEHLRGLVERVQQQLADATAQLEREQSQYEAARMSAAERIAAVEQQLEAAQRTAVELERQLAEANEAGRVERPRPRPRPRPQD